MEDVPYLALSKLSSVKLSQKQAIMTLDCGPLEANAVASGAIELIVASGVYSKRVTKPISGLELSSDSFLYTFDAVARLFLAM